MLDACAEILDETGYEGLSTTLIAERADVAIGSVYQFFPGKRAIAQALTLRNLELFGDRVAQRLAERPLGHWSEAVGLVLDIYVDMHRHVAGFRALRFGDTVDAHLLDSGLENAGLDNNAVIAQRLRTLLVEAAGVADTPELTPVLAVAVEAGDAVLKLAFRRHPDGDERILAEAERLIRSYLATHLD
jgi:AcrR family transcriptional regulator